MPARVVDPDRRAAQNSRRAREARDSLRRAAALCASSAHPRAPSAVSMRCTSDSLLISSEKTATGTFFSIAAYCAMLSTSAVFPIDGRAATMTRSAGWKPDVSSSRSVKPLGDAGDRLAAALQRLDALHRRPHQLLHAREALQPALLAHLEDSLLRVVEQLLGRGAALERLGDDRRGGLDQAAQQRLLLHDLRVVLDVRRRRHRVDQLADVFLAARRIELAAPIAARSASVTGSTTSLRCEMAIIARKIRRWRSS